MVCVNHIICLRRPTLGPASATSPVYICQPQYLFTSARAVTCIGHNMCLHRPQHLFTSANTGTCVGHNTCIRRPQYLFTSARTVTCIDHNTWLRRPQHLFTSARAVTCIGHNMCLHRPQHLFMSANTGTCVGHWLVAFPDSRGPRNPTGSAQCNGPMCKTSTMSGYRYWITLER